MHAAQEPPLDAFDGPVPVGGGMMAPGGRGPAGRQGTPPPPPSLADRASRFGSPQDGPPRSSLPMPSGAPVAGLGDPLADREVKREVKREQPNRTGLIDPDEPTEGLRMLYAPGTTTRWAPPRSAVAPIGRSACLPAPYPVPGPPARRSLVRCGWPGRPARRGA